MRLTISENAKEHKDLVAAATWTPKNELITASDDGLVLRWSMDGEMQAPICKEGEFSPTAVSWYPAVGKSPPDLMAVGCADGTFRHITKAGREEKKVAAHTGAVTGVRWNFDGAALLTTMAFDRTALGALTTLVVSAGGFPVPVARLRENGRAHARLAARVRRVRIARPDAEGRLGAPVLRALRERKEAVPLDQRESVDDGSEPTRGRGAAQVLIAPPPRERSLGQYALAHLNVACRKAAQSLVCALEHLEKSRRRVRGRRGAG